MGMSVIRVRSLVILFVIAALIGCQRTPKPVEPDPPPRMPASLPLFRPARADRENMSAIVRANNAFALASTTNSGRVPAICLSHLHAFRPGWL